MSRPRKNVTALQGVYTKEEMQSRLEDEKRIKGKSDDINPPEYIQEDEIALKKFFQLSNNLGDAGILSNVDVDLLAVYSDCWSKYIKATKILAIQDMVEEQETKSGLTKAQNPYLKIQNTYSDKLIKLSSLFGLSPADRSKIAHLDPSDKEQKVDPLMELLGKLK